MKHVKVLTKIFRDNTGKGIELYSILIEHNGETSILYPLHEYQLKNHMMSRSWHNKLIQAVELMLDYIDANQNCFSSPKDFFECFTESIYSGTINEDGFDPSGLYWLPKKIKTASNLLFQLNQFSDWMVSNYNSKPLNPWRQATSYEERLNWMAINNKSNKSFLGHLDSYLKMSETARKVRNVIQRKPPSGDKYETKSFPEDKIHELLWEGFKITNKKDDLSLLESYNWRDIAITILMHGGGIRHSEAYHIWVNDVMPDPYDPKLALVRIYHPIDGAAPKDIKNPSNGRYITNREAYLDIKYGILPRNKYSDKRRYAGWKNPKMTDVKQNYMQVHWFPRQWGYLFMQVWKMYMAQRIHEHIPDTHPFLFVSFKDKYKGDMYSMQSFIESHNKAVEKIGLTVGKMYGTTVHGHRHAWGQRGRIANLDRPIMQAGLHHKSEESQDVYTEPTIDMVTKELTKASKALERGIKLPMSIDIESYFNQERKFQKKWYKKEKK